MHYPALHGKTVLILTPSKAMAEYFEDALKNLGATVIFSNNSPRQANSVPSIGEEIGKNSAKIDALIIYNSNIEETEIRNVALELAKLSKKQRAIIVCDTCTGKADIQHLLNGGVKYLNSFDLDNAQIAFKVADIIAQQDKAESKTK